MYKPDEKDIDRLSREAAEHYHAPGNPAWEALQQVLDKELPQKEERKRRGFFFFFFLLMGLSLTGSVLWYGIQITKNKQQPAPTANIKDKGTETSISGPAGKGLPATSATAANAPAVPAPTGDAAKNTQPNSTNTAGYNNDDAPGTAARASTDKTADNSLAGGRPATKQNAIIPPPLAPGSLSPAAAVFKKNKLPPAGQSNKKIYHKKVNTSDNALAAAAGKKTGSKTSSWQKTDGNENIAAVNSRTNPQRTSGGKGRKTFPALTNTDTETGREDAAGSGVDASSGVGETSAKTTVTRQDNNSTDTLLTPLAAADTAAVTKTVTIDSSGPNAIAVNKQNDSANAARKKKTSKNNKAINIGILAGMDISTVKFTHGDNAGYNLGLMAGYQPNRRWAVYTGIVYTKKNYKLNGKDYHPPKHYWTQYVKLQTVEGYCRMWELPLQIRYTFNPGAKTAFFASTGVSSYFMTRQRYNYSYKNNMNQQLTAVWSNDSTFKHVFSILHLSVGIEKPLGKHMNWQIEPYAKVPLGAGVGFGNIWLSSFGVNFSVQYRQRIRR